MSSSMLSVHVSREEERGARHLSTISRHQGDRRVVDHIRISETTMAGIQEKKKFRSWTLNFNRRPSERQELPSPPGFASSVAVSHAEEKRETDPSLVTKVSLLLSHSSSHLFSRVTEELGDRFGAYETDPDEHVPDVHGGEQRFHLPDHDGRHVVHAADQSSAHTVRHV